MHRGVYNGVEYGLFVVVCCKIFLWMLNVVCEGGGSIISNINILLGLNTITSAFASSSNWVVTSNSILCHLFSIYGSTFGDWSEDLSGLFAFCNMSFNFFAIYVFTMNGFCGWGVVIITNLSKYYSLEELMLHQNFNNKCKIVRVLLTIHLAFHLNHFAWAFVHLSSSLITFWNIVSINYFSHVFLHYGNDIPIAKITNLVFMIDCMYECRKYDVIRDFIDSHKHVHISIK